MDFGLKDAVAVFLDWVDKHLTFRYFSMAFLICLAVAFGVNPILRWVGLPLLPSVYRVGAVLFGAISLAGSAHMGWEYIWIRIRRRWHLYRLSASERKTLSCYISADNPVQFFDPNEFVSTTLLDLGIIRLADSEPAYASAAQSNCYYYGIDNATFQFLKSHRRLLQ